MKGVHAITQPAAKVATAASSALALLGRVRVELGRSSADLPATRTRALPRHATLTTGCWALAALALALGVATAALSAGNRARADELDALERWCEAQARRNELQRVENEKAEWRLSGQKPGPSADEVKP